jgi:hypothetical protein
MRGLLYEVWVDQYWSLDTLYFLTPHERVSPSPLQSLTVSGPETVFPGLPKTLANPETISPPP